MNSRLAHQIEINTLAKDTPRQICPQFKTNTVESVNRGVASSTRDFSPLDLEVSWSIRHGSRQMRRQIENSTAPCFNERELTLT